MEKKIRLILRRVTLCQYSGLQTSGLYTLDIDCPELVEHLTRGGRGESSYDLTTLVDAEVVDANP